MRGMKRALGPSVAASLAALLVLAACDQEWAGPSDALLDYLGDTGETGSDVEPDEPCIYPEAPYAFSGVGDTVAPMWWPTMVRGTDERTTDGSLSALHCDPLIESIFIHVAADT